MPSRISGLGDAASELSAHCGHTFGPLVWSHYAQHQRRLMKSLERHLKTSHTTLAVKGNDVTGHCRINDDMITCNAWLVLVGAKHQKIVCPPESDLLTCAR